MHFPAFSPAIGRRSTSRASSDRWIKITKVLWAVVLFKFAIESIPSHNWMSRNNSSIYSADDRQPTITLATEGRPPHSARGQYGNKSCKWAPLNCILLGLVFLPTRADCERAANAQFDRRLSDGSWRNACGWCYRHDRHWSHQTHHITDHTTTTPTASAASRLNNMCHRVQHHATIRWRRRPTMPNMRNVRSFVRNISPLSNALEYLRVIYADTCLPFSANVEFWRACCCFGAHAVCVRAWFCVLVRKPHQRKNGEMRIRPNCLRAYMHIYFKCMWPKIRRRRRHSRQRHRHCRVLMCACR